MVSWDLQPVSCGFLEERVRLSLNSPFTTQRESTFMARAISLASSAWTDLDSLQTFTQRQKPPRILCVYFFVEKAIP